MFVAGISVEMFTASSTIFFLIQFVKKQEITLFYFFICFSKPLNLIQKNKVEDAVNIFTLIPATNIIKHL